jgi:methylisocitrate lyase
MSWLLDGIPAQSRGARLRQLLDAGEPLAVPGVFNPLAALSAKKVGFDALYFSGAAFSASLGLPDLGLFTLDELSQAVRWVVRACDLPLIVDADTGFGEALNVMRVVKELEDAGAAAVQIEDQVMPKRCGHLEGKSVVTAEAFAEKVRAAVHAREDLLVVARTDARATHGLDEAIRRGRLYKEAGADVIFPEALETEDEFKAYADAVGGPLLANMTEFGKSPYLTVERFGELGYSIVIFPVTTLRVAMKAVESALRDIRDKGTQAGWLQNMQTRKELYQLIEYQRYEEEDRQLAEGRE